MRAAVRSIRWSVRRDVERNRCPESQLIPYKRMVREMARRDTRARVTAFRRRKSIDNRAKMGVVGWTTTEAESAARSRKAALSGRRPGVVCRSI